MLIHKATMGVLTYVWNQNGTILVKATFARCPYLNKDEWWEVRANTAIGRIALRYYPFITPVVQDGELIDVIPDRPSRPSQDPCMEEMRDSAKKRRYERVYRTLPKTGLLDFLSGDLHEKIASGTRGEEVRGNMQ